jgi:hypothetical protein
MSSTRGPPFTTPPLSPILCEWAAELNSVPLASCLPSGTSLRLVHRFLEATCRGTYVADGYSIALQRPIVRSHVALAATVHTTYHGLHDAPLPPPGFQAHVKLRCPQPQLHLHRQRRRGHSTCAPRPHLRAMLLPIPGPVPSSSLHTMTTAQNACWGPAVPMHPAARRRKQKCYDFARSRLPARQQPPPPSPPPPTWAQYVPDLLQPPSPPPLHKPLTLTRCRMLIFKTQRDDFLGATILALGSSNAGAAQWARSAIPTNANSEVVLQNAVRARYPHWHVALLDNTDTSPLDTAHGHYEPILAELSKAVPTTIPAMSQAFTEMIAPLGTAKTTRGKAQRNWRTVLTWGAARGALNHILPMAPSTLHAMLWDFSAMGCSRSTLKAIVDAVIARHRDVRVDSPVSGHMT